jgi:methylmalonyl-CoA mutase C-terminal domain/subunit
MDGKPLFKRGSVMDRKIRVLIAKPGLDGHEMGAKLIARVLRDAGMEVIYTGMRQTPAMIVDAAIQEDVDVIGMSILSGSHVELSRRVSRLLAEKGARNILLLVGGIIPEEDVPKLKEIGIRAVFGPGTDTREVIDFLRENVTVSG